MGLVGSKMVRYGVAIGADTSQGAPGDALEYSASAGGAAYLIGSENIIAKINKTLSYTTDTPDFWRREGSPYPSHGGRFTGEPAYFKHIGSAARMMMSAMQTEPKDYKYAIFHQPNGKFPTRIAMDLGFTEDQIKDGLLTPFIGNTYSGSVPLGLAAVLDRANPGDRILVVAYGSGAGSDAFDITVTEEIEKYNRSAAPTVAQRLTDTVQLDYGRYAKFKGKIIMGE
jgi:hydroxymethylglutaryl-CoA synthase